jgi:hypothetical protein
MGPDLGLFLQINGQMGTEFRAGESDGFTGVFGICILRTTDANRSRFTHISLNLKEVRKVICETFFSGDQEYRRLWIVAIDAKKDLRPAVAAHQAHHP